MSEELNLPCKLSMVTRKCECGGEMKFVPSTFTTLEYPPQYTHQCNKCGKTERFPVQYPYLHYEYEFDGGDKNENNL